MTAFVLASRATRRHAIMAVNNAVAAANPALPCLTIRADDGSQYPSREFRPSIDTLEDHLEYIYVDTPEQNGQSPSTRHSSMSGRASLQAYKKPEAMLAAFKDYNPQNPLCGGI